MSHAECFASVVSTVHSPKPPNARVKPTCVAQPATWQALPAMLLVERSRFGLNELLDLSYFISACAANKDFTGTPPCFAGVNLRESQ